MSWSPSIAKKLDEAVRPFENAPRDWNDVLARSGEAQVRVGRPRLGSRNWSRRRVVVGIGQVAVIALWLLLVLTLAFSR